jgi:hypothetical protein
MELVLEIGQQKVWRVHLMPGDAVPSFALAEEFKCVIWSTCAIENDWRNRVADQLVADRMRYMMAGGLDGTIWDDAVDWADIGRFPDFVTPDEKFVMTTWHDLEALAHALWFALRNGGWDDLWFDQLLVLWVGPLDQRWNQIEAFSRRILEDGWIPES